jgi:hypothetical protein
MFQNDKDLTLAKVAGRLVKTNPAAAPKLREVFFQALAGE